MITIKSFVFNAFQENTYALYDETGDCILVDAGCYSSAEKQNIDAFLQQHQLTLKKLVNTHCHVDHVLGMAYLAQKYNPEIWIHPGDAKLMEDARKHGLIFGFDAEEPPKATHFLEDGQELKIGNSSLQIYHVPGHSPGSVAIHSREGNFVVVGDVLFKGSIGRTDLPGGNYDQLIESIFKKLMVLPPETIVYSGHGPSTTIHEEALSNPFLA